MNRVSAHTSKIINVFSTALILLAIVLIVLTFWPIAKEEVKYNFHQVLTTVVKVPEKPLVPPNTEFSIIVPKINAAAPIVANVDASDSKKYLSALKRGVAHANGTALPGQTGNVFLFAHSTDTFYN